MSLVLWEARTQMFWRQIFPCRRIPCDSTESTGERNRRGWGSIYETRWRARQYSGGEVCKLADPGSTRHMGRCPQSSLKFLSTVVVSPQLATWAGTLRHPRPELEHKVSPPLGLSRGHSPMLGVRRSQSAHGIRSSLQSTPCSPSSRPLKFRGSDGSGWGLQPGNPAASWDTFEEAQAKPHITPLQR